MQEFFAGEGVRRDEEQADGVWRLDEGRRRGSWVMAWSEWRRSGAAWRSREILGLQSGEKCGIIKV